jgi:hypothetical protein
LWEAHATGEAPRPEIEAAAQERQLGSLKQGAQPPSRSGNLPEREQGQTRDQVAAAVGMSGKTYEKIATVVAAAAADTYGDLVGAMDTLYNHSEVQVIGCGWAGAFVPAGVWAEPWWSDERQLYPQPAEG